MSEAVRPFQIRPISQNDNIQIATVIRTVMPEFGCSGPGFAIHDSEVDDMHAAYCVAGSGYFVVEKEGKVFGGAGFAGLQGGRPGQCELRKMYLLEEARGFGLGDDLLDLCLKEARIAGYSYCYLETTTQMLKAQRLYSRYGFQELPAPMGQTGHFSCDKWYGREL